MPSTQNMTAEERAQDAQLRLDLVLDAAKMALWDMTVDAGDFLINRSPGFACSNA